jgi:uncharacterized membrane protein
MEVLNRTGRIFYGTAIAATGIQQFFFPEFFHLLFPPLPFRIAGLLFVSRLVAAVLVIAGTAIALNKKTRDFA